MPHISQNIFLRSLIVAVLSTLPLAAFAQTPTITVTQLDGTRSTGQLTAWTAAELTLQVKGQTQTIAASQLLRAQFSKQRKNKKQPLLIELVDGTRLPHAGYEVTASRATIVTPLAKQPLSLATRKIAFVQLLSDGFDRSQIEEPTEGDLLVIYKKKTGTLDHLSGILGGISAEQVVFNWDGEEIPVKRSKVAALVYFHAKKIELSRGPVCWLNLQNGARLPVSELAVNGEQVQVKTVSDLEFTVSLDSILHADYSQSKLAYLSDLQPIEQRWTPQIGLPSSAQLLHQHGLPRRDQSFTGSALSLRWPTKKLGGEVKTYEKGLAIRSRTVCRYRLPKGMRRFVTLAGIDPETTSQGNVTLEIFADKRPVWQGVIAGNAVPTEINVELGNARELKIAVDYGENLDFGDRLHLIEARLSR